MSTKTDAGNTKKIRVVEMVAGSTPITVGEYNRADREGRLEQLLADHKYRITFA